MSELIKIKGIGPAFSKQLSEIGIIGLADLASANEDSLVAIRGVSTAKAKAFRNEAATLAQDAETSAPKTGKPGNKAKDSKKKKSKKKDVEKFEKALKKAAKKAAKKTAKKAKKSKKSGGKKKG